MVHYTPFGYPWHQEWPLGGFWSIFDRFLSAGALLPSTLFTFSVQGTSVLLLIRALYAPCQLADRAFGAQRFSGGRTGRRFAPPSGGAALRAALRAPKSAESS